MKQAKVNVTVATLCLLPVFWIQSVSGGTMKGALDEASFENEVSLLRTDIKVSPQLRSDNGYTFEQSMETQYTEISSYDSKGNVYKWVCLDKPAKSNPVYFRIKLKNPDQGNQLKFKIEEKEIDLSVEKGIVWIDPGNTNLNGDDTTFSNQSFSLIITATSPLTVEYDLEAFASKEDVLPLATSSGKIVYLKKSPNIICGNRIMGDCGVDIPYTIQIDPGSMSGQAAKLFITMNDVNDKVSIKGDNIDIQNESPGIWKCDIPSFTATSYKFLINASDDVTSAFRITLLDEQLNYISGSTEVDIVIPTIFCKEEIEALRKIATANLDNKELDEFISKESWKENRQYPTDNYHIGVYWNTKTPSHIVSIFINGQRTSLNDLDLTAFPYLERIDLSGNTSLKSLDLSKQTALKSLNAYNTSLRFSTLKLADNINPSEIECYCHTTISGLATPIDENSSLAASGTGIDLSSEAEIKEYKSNFQWNKVTLSDNMITSSEPVTMEVVSDTPGNFILKGNPGEYYQCIITNSIFPNWSMETVPIKISRENVTYAEQDIAGLEKIANENPNIPKLKEFIENEGWTLDNWNSFEEIKTDWKFDNNNILRLTHLCIQPDYGTNNIYLDKLDISAFSELQHLECELHNRIAVLDVSKNPKLEILRIYTENLETLDVSFCPNLKELTFREERAIQMNVINKLSSLNIDGCTKLTKLQIVGPSIESLDISKTPLLETLFIGDCNKLKINGNINELKKLQELGLNSTTQFSEYAKNPPSTVVRLFCMGTDYPLPNDDALARLEQLTLPQTVTAIDLTKTPNLNNLDLWNSKVRYSSIKRANNMLNPYQYNGESYYVLPDYTQDIRPTYKKGDIIDLSSESVIDGEKTTYTWVNLKYNTEDTNTFMEDPDKPGVFTVSQDAEASLYNCIMSNPLFTTYSTVNSWGGWRVLFEISIEGSIPEKHFNDTDVNTLQKIVTASSDEDLKSWWSEGVWQKNGLYRDRINIVWNDENPSRLVELELRSFAEGLTSELDLSDLDALITLNCQSNNLTKLTLPKNPTALKTLILIDNLNLKTLILSPYSNLEELDIQSTGIKNCDLTNNHKLKSLHCNGLELDPIVDLSDFPDLEEFGAPLGLKTMDMKQVPNLKRLDPGYTLKFSDILNPHQLESVYSYSTFYVGDINGEATAYGSEMNVSKEMKVGENDSKIVWERFPADPDSPALEGGTNGIYTITSEQFEPGDRLRASITNSLFPGWTVEIETEVYSCAGDANLDKVVNVQDITATVSEILEDEENWLEDFGYLEADVNGDDELDVSDIVGIVGIIQNKPVAAEPVLRSASKPVVRLSTDERGFLYMDAPVAIAGIQLAFIGVKSEISLLGRAARFVQASVVGDTLRMLAYCVDEMPLSSGKSVLMQLPEGARLVEAAFSDANAHSLKWEGRDIATANEPVAPVVQEVSIRNYPNPFRNTTTFMYSLKEGIQEAGIQIFSVNGALVKTIDGLPTAAGQHTYPCSFSLPAGVYYYRLLVKEAGIVKNSKSNMFIIK